MPSLRFIKLVLANGDEMHLNVERIVRCDYMPRTRTVTITMTDGQQHGIKGDKETKEFLQKLGEYSL